jgi:hypothetical protein
MKLLAMKLLFASMLCYNGDGIARPSIREMQKVAMKLGQKMTTNKDHKLVT